MHNIIRTHVNLTRYFLSQMQIKSAGINPTKLGQSIPFSKPGAGRLLVYYVTTELLFLRGDIAIRHLQPKY